MNTISLEALALLPQLRDKLRLLPRLEPFMVAADPKWRGVHEVLEDACHNVWVASGSASLTRLNCSDWPRGALAGSLLQVESFDALQVAIWLELENSDCGDDTDLAVLEAVRRVREMEMEDTRPCTRNALS